MEKRRLRTVIGAEIAAKFPAGLEKPRRRHAAPAGRDNHRRRQRPAGGVVGAEGIVKRFGDLADGARPRHRQMAGQLTIGPAGLAAGQIGQDRRQAAASTAASRG